MTYFAQELIRRKRDGAALEDAELEWLVRGIADGSVTDGQAAAFAMAVFFRDLDARERVTLTRAMTRSGAVLEWDLPGRVVDKHSTGGVGDKVSLILAPVLAACGAFVPMISGRGLGHTGGTLDKLDAIPGYDSRPELERLRDVVATAGCAIVGQTAELAPADRRLYALRDATGTVESIPLIVASILSKKLAEGLDALVMDVKAGSGAFMPERQHARELARAIVEVAEGSGLPCAALLTDMNQVLGRTAGNAVEVREAIDVLREGEGEPRLVQVTLALAEAVLALAGLDADPGGALASGAAAERFGRMVAALGGPADLLDGPERHLPRAPVTREVRGGPGGVTGVRVRELGLVVMELGGGRRRADDDVDPAVGLTAVAGLGEPAERLAVVHARDEASAERAAERVRAAFEAGDEPAPTPVLVERC
ncbi:MAG TPA: thymidine phosphorylase [Solirubrobacteraceae bacterium]|nr:thymidine phosphorylase [Solirubrobacteraceae bacterium]